MPRGKAHWDRRFRDGSYSRDPEPPVELERHIESLPGGRALDVATGTGRLSVFLAAAGYDVDALDLSRVGLEIARERAADRDLAVNWVQADATTFHFPEETYDLVTVRSFRSLDRLADLEAALTPGGVLFYQDHLRTAEPTDSGPRDDRDRLAPNELLRACLGLTVLRYAEFRTVEDDGTTGAYAQVLARKPGGDSRPLPR